MTKMAVTKNKQKFKGGSLAWDSRGQQERFRAHLDKRREITGQFVVGLVKRTLSKGQPTHRQPSGRMVATTKAQPGAAPRVVEGTLRNSVSFGRRSGPKSISLLIGAFTPGARRLELGFPRGHKAHPYLRPTILDNRKEIVKRWVGPGLKGPRAKKMGTRSKRSR